jgi:hypothetical protein
MSAFNTQTPGKYPEDNLSLQHGESLKTSFRHIYSLANIKINEYGPVKKEYPTGTRFLFLLFLITMKMFTKPYPVTPAAVHKVQ